MFFSSILEVSDPPREMLIGVMLTGFSDTGGFLADLISGSFRRVALTLDNCLLRPFRDRSGLLIWGSLILVDPDSMPPDILLGLLGAYSFASYNYLCVRPTKAEPT